MSRRARCAGRGRRVIVVAAAAVTAVALAGCSIGFEVRGGIEPREPSAISGDPALVRDGWLTLDFTTPPSREEVGLRPGSEHAHYSYTEETPEFPVRILLPEGQQVELMAYYVKSRSESIFDGPTRVGPSEGPAGWTRIFVRYPTEEATRSALEAQAPALEIDSSSFDAWFESIHDGRRDADLLVSVEVQSRSEEFPGEMDVQYLFGHHQVDLVAKYP